MYSTIATLFSEINNNNFNEQTIFTFGKDKWPFLSYDTINLESVNFLILIDSKLPLNELQRMNHELEKQNFDILFKLDFSKKLKEIIAKRELEIKNKSEFEKIEDWYHDTEANPDHLTDEQKVILLDLLGFELKTLKNGNKVLYHKQRQEYDVYNPKIFSWGKWYPDAVLETLTEDDDIIFYKNFSDAISRLEDPYLSYYYGDDE